MRRTPSFEIQPLESRRFLSVAPIGPGPGPGGGGPGGDRPPVLDCPEVIEAREDVQAATEQLRTDQRAGRTTIREDQLAARAEYQKLIDDKGAEVVNEAIAPLKAELRADEIAKNKELRAAAEELRIAKRESRQLIAGDLADLREAQESGDQQAIDDAKATLEADKAKVQEDLKPIRDNIIAIKDRWRPIITADHEAIESKLEELDPALKPLFDKLNADAMALQEKLTADLAAVQTASAALKQAIIDCKDEAMG